MRVAGVVLFLLTLPFLLLSTGCAGRADPKYTVSFDVEELPPEPPAPPPPPRSDPLRTLRLNGDDPFDPSSSVASLEEERLKALNSRLVPVHFESSRWGLTPAGIQAVIANAVILDDSGGFRAFVEGHGDARGTDAHNTWLGLWRAKVVKEALVAAGVDPGRLSLLTYGRSRPADQGEDEESLARNRRVEIRVISTH